MKKKYLIIDSDVASGVDERFALVYAFLRKDVSVKAVTLEPFVSEGMELNEAILDSKFETERLLKFMGNRSKDLVFEGSSVFFNKYDGKPIDAVNKIHEIALKSDGLTIICTGVLTNIAILLSKFPEIKDKVCIVWLGLGNLMKEKFDDKNYLGDVAAFESVVKSGADLTTIPDFLASRFSFGYYDLEHDISGSLVGDYLLKQVKDSANNGDGLKSVEFLAMAPLVWALSPEMFSVSEVEACKLLKSNKKAGKDISVKYAYEVKDVGGVWKDFTDKINKIDVDIFAPKVFFVSDTHFSQIRKVRLKQVPFRTLSESDGELVLRWNKVVWKNDIVFHLGDFGNYEKVKELNGKITLICGNYEVEDIKVNFDGNFEKFRQYLLGLGFAEVYENGIYLDEKVLGERVFLTHKPTDCDKHCFNLFGHVHTLAPVKRFGFNVCISYHNFTPISASKVKRYIDFVKNHSDEDVFA